MTLKTYTLTVTLTKDLDVGVHEELPKDVTIAEIRTISSILDEYHLKILNRLVLQETLTKTKESKKAD